MDCTTFSNQETSAENPNEAESASCKQKVHHQLLVNSVPRCISCGDNAKAIAFPSISYDIQDLTLGFRNRGGSRHFGARVERNASAEAVHTHAHSGGLNTSPTPPGVLPPGPEWRSADLPRTAGHHSAVGPASGPVHSGPDRAHRWNRSLEKSWRRRFALAPVQEL